jgi:hypothetical protein
MVAVVRTLMELLTAHPAICGDCLILQMDSRSDVVFPQLERLGLAAEEGHCATCATDTAVYRAAHRR